MPPESPHFSAWAAPKGFAFSTWTAPKDPPFQKYTFVCSTFPGLLQKTPFKSIRFFVIFSFKIPFVFQWGAALKAPYFQWGALSPLFSNFVWHIYTTFIYEYPRPWVPPGYNLLTASTMNHPDDNPLLKSRVFRDSSYPYQLNLTLIRNLLFKNGLKVSYQRDLLGFFRRIQTTL